MFRMLLALGALIKLDVMAIVFSSLNKLCQFRLKSGWHQRHSRNSWCSRCGRWCCCSCRWCRRKLWQISRHQGASGDGAGNVGCTFYKDQRILQSVLSTHPSVFPFAVVRIVLQLPTRLFKDCYALAVLNHLEYSITKSRFICMCKPSNHFARKNLAFARTDCKIPNTSK